MFEFSDDERVYLNALSAITMDSQGRETLVGLTLEETAIYMNHSRKFLTGDRDRDGREAYLALHEKHEKARFEVLGAEIYLRNENPARH